MGGREASACHGRGSALRNRSDLFVRVFGIDRRLGLVGPDALVEGLQEGALHQRQRTLHLAPAQPQRLLALRRVPEAQRVQLPHLVADTNSTDFSV